MTQSAFPRVSIALCTFNGARYLEPQLESIAGQTRLPDELIIADDGSSDDTLAVLSRWSAEHPQLAVRVLPPTTHLGVTANFERAIAATSGDIIVLSDQDDVWSPARIENAVAALGGQPFGALHTDAELIDGDGHRLGETLFGRLGMTAHERSALLTSDLFSTYLRRNLATGATMAFTRSVWEMARPLPSTWVHDEWIAMIAASCDGLRCLEEPAIQYRIHGANVIGAVRPTVRYKLGRVLGGRGERNARLASRFAELFRRWDSLGVNAARYGISDSPWSARGKLVAEKAQFERSRAAMPRTRVARLPTVIRLAMRGHYRSFASRGRLDIVRDLLQT